MVQCIFSLLCELFYNPRDVVGLLGDCAADFAPWDVAIGGRGTSNLVKNLLTFSRSKFVPIREK